MIKLDKHVQLKIDVDGDEDILLQDANEILREVANGCLNGERDNNIHEIVVNEDLIDFLNEMRDNIDTILDY